MTVYLDVIWVLNLLFDSLLLYLTGVILKREIRPWRVVTGGFAGSILILLPLTPLGVYGGHPLTKLMFSVVMVWIAFGYKRLRFFLSGLMGLYLTTFLIGGALIGVHYFVQFNSGPANEVIRKGLMGFGDPISWLFVLLGFPLAWHFSRKNIENLEMAKIQFDQIVNVHIMIDGESYSFKGLIDSGNQLYDPLSRLPVMFVSITGRTNEMPEHIVKIATEGENILQGSCELPDEWQSRLRIIPFSVVGQEQQLVIGVIPDGISIESKGQVFTIKKGIVSFTLQQLSSDSAFQCIVHPKMLTGSAKPMIAS